MSKVAFCGRSGVITEPMTYKSMDLTEFKIYSEAPEALNRLGAAGYLICVVTNEVGIIEGQSLVKAVEVADQSIKRLVSFPIVFMHCFHEAKEQCKCRFPEPGLLEAVMKGNTASSEDCIMLAGSITDVDTAANAGIHNIAAITKSATWKRKSKVTKFYPDLLAAVFGILKGELNAPVAG